MARPRDASVMCKKSEIYRLNFGLNDGYYQQNKEQRQKSR